MGKTIFSWFSANDDGEVVAKTDVHDDGEVHRYPYTEEDDITKGHGHIVYPSMEDFIMMIQVGKGIRMILIVKIDHGKVMAIQ